MRIPRPCLAKLSFFSLIFRCLNGCGDQAQVVSDRGTKIRNLSDRPVELQIRVGATLKKVHTLKPGSSKRLKCKAIYKAYMAGAGADGREGLLYYYDGRSCEPYVWIHDSMRGFSRMVKQQFISLEDLRDFCEIRIFRDCDKGECISVLKKPRQDVC